MQVPKAMRHLQLSFVLLAMMASAPAASADVLELKTGERVEGTFKQATVAGGVVIEIGGQSITMPFAKVRAIYIGAAPTAAPAVSAAKEALDALMGLQSVTNAGISYLDYAPRVLDAKIKVDKYLSGSSEGDAPRAAIRIAMQYYELAATAWNGSLMKYNDKATQVGRTLRGDPALMECPSVRTAIAGADASAVGISGGYIGEGKFRVKLPQKTAAETAETAVYFTGTHVGQNPAILWSCGSDKIAEAEELLKDKPAKPSTNPAANPAITDPTPSVAPKTETEPAKKPEGFIIQGGESQPRKK